LPAPTRRRRPVRTLVTLGSVILALAAILGAGVIWSDATLTPKLALDLEGGTQIILTPVPEAAGQVTSTTIDQAIGVIRQRVDASGVSEAEITSQGTGASAKIVVSLPGHPSEETLDLVRTSAQMEFRPVLVAGTAAPTTAATPAPTSTDASSEATPAPTPTATTDEEVSAAPDATAEPTATATPTPTPTATTEPGEGPTSPTSPSDTTYYVTAEVQATYDALDCTDPANRTGGVNGAADEAFVTCDTEGTAKYILGPVEVEGKHIKSASSGLQQLSNGSVGTEWVVNLAFDGEGTTKFADTTTRLYSLSDPLNRFAIVLDGLVISAPRVTSVIPNGQAEISGSFTRESAATLANQLNFGALPVSFQVESEQQISATLGAEQLEKGMLAGLIGLILVVIYSLLQYRLLGLLTVSSLVLAAIITYLVITLLSWTQGYRLSLPGVAGLIVAIGITADSFIVYFERIRDELRDGRTLGAAVEHGWARARRTILASDAVNFLAAIVLYLLAVGGVRGFAFTLGLTTIIDLIIVFFFTHPMMEIISRWRFFNEGHSWSGLDPRRLGVPGTRYVGRGRVATGPRETGPRTASVEPAAAEPAADEPAPTWGSAPKSSDGLTIAQRRAAAKAAAADGVVDDVPGTTGTSPAADESSEGNEHCWPSASPSGATTSTPVAGRTTSSDDAGSGSASASRSCSSRWSCSSSRDSTPASSSAGARSSSSPASRTATASWRSTRCSRSPPRSCPG
jgi:preprotein translocase subunit SecD